MPRLALASLLATSVAGQMWPSDIYNPTKVYTVNGCVCKSECQTSVLFECNAAPFCEVEDKDCRGGSAHPSLSHGYYDYCKYGPYQTYEHQTAAQKKSIVMAHINGDAGSSGKYPSTLGVLTGIMGESVMVSFDASTDVFPEERKKQIHSVGVTGGIKFESSGGHNYGGLFQGAEHGLIRFSSAKQPGSGGVAPGMGIKFFRDGRPSANFVAMYSLDGQPCKDSDFFQHVWSNHIKTTDNFGLKLIAAKFWQASYCPLMVGLSDLASNDDRTQGAFPFRLNFYPLVESDCPCDDYVTCLGNLQKIAVGTKIFDVQAVSKPGATSESIGHIVLTDELVTTKFGDEQLFFSHQHMEDDFNLKPDWLAAIDRKEECGMDCAGIEAPPISKGCSSPFHGAANSTMMLSSDVVV